MSLRQLLRKARLETKIDWAIRDLAIKTVRNMWLSGASENEIKRFKGFLIRKLEEDLEHELLLLRVKQMFEQAGFQVVLSDIREKLSDMLAMRPGETWWIEIKARAPPWGGENYKEYNRYYVLDYRIMFVWRDGRGAIKCCTYAETKLENGLVHPLRQRYLAELLKLR